MSSIESFKVTLFEFRAEGIKHSTRVTAKDLHLSKVRVGGEVAFESVFVSTLFGTHLAIEFELSERLVACVCVCVRARESVKE